MRQLNKLEEIKQIWDDMLENKLAKRCEPWLSDYRCSFEPCFKDALISYLSHLNYPVKSHHIDSGRCEKITDRQNVQTDWF